MAELITFDLETGERIVSEYTPEPQPPETIIIPESVTARQFKMQLVISGLKAGVDGWVSQQDELVQVAYACSSNFVRTEPMLQAGFKELGFTEKQMDEFYLAASKL